MKRKEFIFTAVVLLIAFIGITIFKNRKYSRQNNSSTVVAKSDSAQAFWAYYNQGTQYRLQDKSDSAIISYQEALKLNPDHKDALYYIGNMYMNVGQFDKARESWEKLTELNPQSERAFNQLGNLYFCTTHPNYFRPEKSKFYFERAYDLNKEAINPTLHLGEIALFQNRTNDAYVIFNKLSMMDQKNKEINFIMGYLDWGIGKKQEAIRNLEQAFELPGTANSAQNPSIPGNLECDLFMNWLANNLTAPEKYDIREAMPDVYRKFDQYLIAMRRQLNHN